MSDRNPRKRKSARPTENENNTSVKTKRTRTTARPSPPQPSPLYRSQQVRTTCPYNLRSHAHLDAAEASIKAGGSSQASTSEVAEWQAERCTICLSTFGRQLVGNPGTCSHSFCLKCLRKWAKESNTCPVGRQKFTHICVRKQLNGRVVRKVQVKSPREVTMAPHLTPVHELQISIHRRVEGHQANNEERLMLINAATSLMFVLTPIL